MDPLFGFIDDLAVQHQEETNTGVGEYTISYPGEHYQLQQQLASQQQSSTTPTQQHVGKAGDQESTGQVVHVVSENSQNEKQIYVIKLENFLKDDGNPEDSTIRFQEGDVEMGESVTATGGDGLFGGGEEEEMATDSGSSEEDTAEEVREKEMDDDGPDPFLVIPPESVMAMAHTVGVELGEDDASELGCLAINKLRNAILIAMQFAQNENSEGIMVEHFAKAEEQLGSPGIGQESVFRESGYKYAGGVSIIDDGPEIDLYACIEQENISELNLDDTDPVLNVHHLRPVDFNYDKYEDTSNPEVEIDEDMAVCRRKTKPEDCQDASDDDDGSEVKVASPNETEDAAIKSASNDFENTPGNPNLPPDDDDSSEEEVADAVNEFISESDNANGDQITSASKEQNAEDGQRESIDLAPEWVSYLQMLIEQVVEHENNHVSGFGLSSDFKRIMRDIRKHGVHPIFTILCDAFRDYLKESMVSQASLMNILCIADALVSSRCEPTLSQMTDLGCVMIEIIILPPPGEVYQYLTYVFMKIMKNCNELLTWTCTYITEILKGISEAPFEEMQESYKSTMHGALCLANGLEELNIQVAHQFGWLTSVLNFSENHASVFDGQAYRPTTQDSFLEEEILKFYYNFMKNYTTLVQQAELTRIREHITTLYGERFATYSPPAPTNAITFSKNVFSTQKHKSDRRKTRCVFRKIVYKDKEIIVPYRKVVK